jgi:hypothetical protein
LEQNDAPLPPSAPAPPGTIPTPSPATMAITTRVDMADRFCGISRLLAQIASVTPRRQAPVARNSVSGGEQSRVS